MIEILAQAVAKIVSSTIEAAAKWGQDKIKARQGVARLLDLHECLLQVETESKTLVAELRKYASDPVKTKTGLERRLEPLIKAVDRFSSKLQDLTRILAVKGPDLYTGLIFVGRGKLGFVYSVLPACVPALVRDDEGRLTTQLRYLKSLPAPESFSTEDAAGEFGPEERRSLDRMVKILARQGKVSYVDAFDGEALLATVASADLRIVELTALRMRLAAFISESFSLKELLQ